jgi:hypothetical protein
MRHEHVDVLAPVQEGVGDVPMIVAEVSGRVLAQPQDEQAPEDDRNPEKKVFLGTEGAAAWVVLDNGHQGVAVRLGNPRPF